jgi:cobalt-zinc-cadmium efflux system outer membrane protein
MRRPLVRHAALVLVLAFATGCAVRPDAAYDDVAQTVGQHSRKRVKWIRSAAEDAQVQQTISTMLQRQLTADAAAQIALLNNRALQAELEEVGISYAEFIQAGLPKNLSLSTFYRNPGRNFEMVVAQDLLDLLLLPFRKAIARQQLEQAKLQVANEILGVIAEAKIAYYELVARQQLLGRLQLIVATNEAGAEIVKRQHDAGNVTDLELASQQVDYSQSRIDVAQTQAQIRSDRERLNRLMGLWGRNLNWLVPDKLPDVPGGEISLSHLESRAMQQRVDIQAAKLQLAVIGRALSLRSGVRGFVDLNVGYNFETEAGQKVQGVQVDAQLPIFDQGQAQIAKLLAQFRQAQRELEAQSINARSEVREARDLLLANRDLAQYYGKVVLPQRILVLNQTQLQFNAMQIGPADLLLAKQNQVATERAYAESWRDYWIARADLERALHGSRSSIGETRPAQGIRTPVGSGGGIGGPGAGGEKPQQGGGGG